MDEMIYRIKLKFIKIQTINLQVTERILMKKC